MPEKYPLPSVFNLIKGSLLAIQDQAVAIQKASGLKIDPIINNIAAINDLMEKYLEEKNPEKTPDGSPRKEEKKVVPQVQPGNK